MDHAPTRRAIYRQHCSECLRPLPDDGDFCPHCGESAAPEERTETQTSGGEGDDDDAESPSRATTDWMPNVRHFRRDNYVGAGLLAAFLTGTAMLVWLSFGTSTRAADGDEPVETARSDAPASGETERPVPSAGLPDVSRELDTDGRIDHRVATLTDGAGEILRLYTAKSTAFASLDRRIRNAELRLEWSGARHRAAAAAGESGDVAVEETDGDRYRVIWRAPSGESTVLVTLNPEDTRHANQVRENDVTTRQLADETADAIAEALDRLAREPRVGA